MRIVKIHGNEADLTICYDIRRQVFIVGQNVPEELEIDGLDQEATHYLIYVNDLAIGTARVRLINPQEGKIERVAILESYQGQGYGSKLINFILKDLQEHTNVKLVILGAQLTALKFYQKLGFSTFGEVFLDAGIEHR